MDPVDEFFSALWKILIFTLFMESLSHFFPTQRIEWLPDWIERALKYAVWGAGAIAILQAVANTVAAQLRATLVEEIREVFSEELEALSRHRQGKYDLHGDES